MLNTRLQRTGLTLAVAGLLLLGVGLVYGEVDRLNQFWRYVAHDYRRYHDGAALVFYGFWTCSAGLYLWFAYPVTLGRLLSWIRAGKRA